MFRRSVEHDDEVNGNRGRGAHVSPESLERRRPDCLALNASVCSIRAAVKPASEHGEVNVSAQAGLRRHSGAWPVEMNRAVAQLACSYHVADTTCARDASDGLIGHGERAASMRKMRVN